MTANRQQSPEVGVSYNVALFQVLVVRVFEVVVKHKEYFEAFFEPDGELNPLGVQSHANWSLNKLVSKVAFEVLPWK